MHNDNQTPEVNDKIRQLQAEVEKARQEQPSQAPARLKRLGQAYLELGNAPGALTEFNEALKLVTKDGDPETQAQLLGFKGLALKLIGNYALALQAFRKSNALATGIKHAQLACDSYIQIAMLQSEADKVTEAISNLSKAMGLALENQDLSRKMRICSLFGDNFYKLQAFDKAVEYYVLGSEAARDLHNRAAECSFLTRVGNIFLLEHELVPAIGQYELALKIASALEDRPAEISILGGLFRAHALSGDVRLASVYGTQAIELAGQIKLHEAGLANIKALAVFLIEQQQAGQAIPLLEQGLKIAAEEGNPTIQMDLAEKLGLAWHSLENYPRALQAYQTSLELAARLNDEPAEALLLGRLALVQAESGEMPASIRNADKALSMAASQQNTRLAAEQQILLAFNYRDCGQTGQALEFCQAAITSFENLEDAGQASQARELLAELAG